MLNEIKIFFDNVKNLRRLNEAVGEGDIVDAINNREYIYIYYSGDKNTAAGSRTVRPMVLGTYTKKGEKDDDAGTHTYLRAWEDRGKSWHFSHRPTRKKSYEHDYWDDKEYDIDKNIKGPKPGWRMFRVDKIKTILPTGIHFIDNSGNVMIPPKYKEGSDKNMDSITAYVTTKAPDSIIQRIGKASEPDVVGYQVGGRWKDFATANKNRRDLVASDIMKLWNIARLLHKKSVRDFIVVIDNKNNYHIRPKELRDRFPDDAVVGELTDLYNYFFNQDKELTQQDKDFERQEFEKFNKEVDDEENQDI